MKTLAALILAGTTLAGCAVVPAGPVVYGPPRVYVAPPPVVVVPARPYYSPYGYGYYRGPYQRGYGGRY